MFLRRNTHTHTFTLHFLGSHKTAEVHKLKQLNLSVYVCIYLDVGDVESLLLLLEKVECPNLLNKWKKFVQVMLFCVSCYPQ